MAKIGRCPEGIIRSHVWGCAMTGENLAEVTLEALTVLIADDEPLMCRGLSKLVKNAGSNFILAGCCRDGLQAFQTILQNRIDILITDIRMPVMNGLELARDIRKQKLQTEIIILSGFPQFEYAQEALSYGVFSYLLKPIDNEKLLADLYKIRDEILAEQQTGAEKQPSADKEYFVGETKTVLPEVAVHYNKTIQKVINHIHKSDSLTVSVENVACELGLNGNYLSHLFKYETGKSFVEYMTALRMKKAQDLLRTTNLKSYAIARMVGYSDSQYFSQVFKRHTGVSPGEFRKFQES